MNFEDIYPTLGINPSRVAEQYPRYDDMGELERDFRWVVERYFEKPERFIFVGG